MGEIKITFLDDIPVANRPSRGKYAATLTHYFRSGKKVGYIKCPSASAARTIKQGLRRAAEDGGLAVNISMRGTDIYITKKGE